MCTLRRGTKTSVGILVHLLSAVVLPGLSLITSVLVFFITAAVLVLRLLCERQTDKQTETQMI